MPRSKKKKGRVKDSGKEEMKIRGKTLPKSDLQVTDVKPEDDPTGPGGADDLANEVDTMEEPGADDYVADLEDIAPVIPTNPSISAARELAPTKVVNRNRMPADVRFKQRRDAIKARRERKASRVGRRRY
jgi:hypothetical protein